MWLAGALALSAMAAELPVRQVVLYKHGVGYFERAGTLAAGEAARLDFKASEMDDVLKSLTIESSGGKIAGLRYDSSEPLAHKLAGFPFQIGAGQPLSAVVDQLKGARLELKFANETVAGAIVAARLTPAEEKHPEREPITLLMDGGELRNFDLGAALGIRFTDARLQLQLKDYLAALTEARSREKRSVYIDSSDAGARQIRASYMIPTPVWKSSYRLIFGETGQPTLEGWAIVDNTTGEDWNQVELSLVSGRPISFVSRLYEPRYITRPTAELAEDRAAAPVVHEGALEDQQMRSIAGLPAAAGSGAFRNSVNAAPVPIPFAKEALESSIERPAATAELGELFEYRIAAPVTVRRNESVMLPFLQQKIEARKLLIYSDQSSAHPMNSAEIVNATGKTLDGGPLTVYEAGAYAGEALMETVKSGDKRLISYGVDLGTRISTLFGSQRDLEREIHVRRGILTTRLAAVETRTYTIRNVDQKAKTLIIEHPARPEYKLLDRQPMEKTANAYRFEVKLAPGATEKFPVTEERTYDQSVSLTDLTPDVLFTYAGNKKLSDAARRQLEQIASRKQQIAAASREMERLDHQIGQIVSDQERLRQNIGSLNQVSGQQQQVQTYARQLANQEAQLAGLRDHRAELEKKRAELESEVSTLIEAMSF
jgi:hypothetical protein